MRLWDLVLIKDGTLPKLQLTSQWRGLVAIKRKIDKCGTPQHGLVNAILDYNIIDFKNYTRAVYDEMCDRDMNFNINLLNEITMWQCDLFDNDRQPCNYSDWLDCRWLETSIYNLQEKAICGLIPYDEWLVIADKYEDVIDAYLWRRK